MKTIIEEHKGVKYLSFKVSEDIGYTKLPVITSGNRDKARAWTWNGNLEKPTLKPSIRTKYYHEKLGKMVEIHYWLTDGIAHCLRDCTDGNSNKKLELLNL